MSKNYVVEYGFDDANVSVDGHFPAMINLVLVADFASTEGTPAWFTQFKVGDQFVIRGYDYSATPKGFSWLDIGVEFVEVNSPGSPFNVVNTSYVNNDHMPECPIRSLVDPGAPGCWELNNGAEWIHTFINAGRALMMMTSNVSFNGMKNEVCGHDPEIFVGPGG